MIRSSALDTLTFQPGHPIHPYSRRNGCEPQAVRIFSVGVAVGSSQERMGAAASRSITAASKGIPLEQKATGDTPFHHHGTTKKLPRCYQKLPRIGRRFGAVKFPMCLQRQEISLAAFRNGAGRKRKKLPNATSAGRKNCQFNPYFGLIAV